MHQTPVTQADGDSRPRFIPPQAKLIGYIVAQPHRLPQFRMIERADCGFCGGAGRFFDGLPCTDCRGTGVELRREDHFALDDDDSFTETDIGHDVEDAY